MKRIAMLAIVFCLGLLVSSFALADDGGKGKGKDKKKCQNVSLKGTAAASTFTVTVDKSNKAGRDLKGKPITLKFEGKVNINATMCSGDSTTESAAAASTFQLRNLKVAKPAASEDDD
jgi:hypothetical protein